MNSQSQALVFRVLCIIAIVILVAFWLNSISKSSSNSSINAYEDKDNPDSTPVFDTGSLPNQEVNLSPEQWYAKYAAAYADCCNQAGPMQYSPDPQENAYITTTYTNKVTALLKSKYPDLYEYLSRPEYKYYLQQRSQEAMENTLQQMQDEADQRQMENDYELQRQAERNQRELEMEKERQERWLEDHPAPEYR